MSHRHEVPNLDPQTLCEKLSVMASLYNTGARELATDRSPELPDHPLSMPQKNKVENDYGKYLTATLTVVHLRTPIPNTLTKKSVRSLWHYYIKENETLTTPQKIGSN